VDLTEETSAISTAAVMISSLDPVGTKITLLRFVAQVGRRGPLRFAGGRNPATARKAANWAQKVARRGGLIDRFRGCGL